MPMLDPHPAPPFPDFLDFLRHSRNVLCALLDENQVIRKHNPAFALFFRNGVSCAGLPWSSLLAPGSPDPLIATQEDDNLPVPLTVLSTLGEAGLSVLLKPSGDGGFWLFAEVFAPGAMEVTEQCSRLMGEMSNLSRDLRRRNRELEEARTKITQLSGKLSICMHCKKIRDDQGHWRQLESYIQDHSEVRFSHGLCRDCMIQHYPDFPPQDPPTDSGV